jgi:hypothetical protein
LHSRIHEGHYFAPNISSLFDLTQKNVRRISSQGRYDRRRLQHPAFQRFLNDRFWDVSFQKIAEWFEPRQSHRFYLMHNYLAGIFSRIFVQHLTRDTKFSLVVGQARACFFDARSGH